MTIKKKEKKIQNYNNEKEKKENHNNIDTIYTRIGTPTRRGYRHADETNDVLFLTIFTRTKRRRR